MNNIFSAKSGDICEALLLRSLCGAGFIVGAGVIAVTVGTGGMSTPAVIGFLVGVAAESAIASAAAIGIDIS